MSSELPVFERRFQNRPDALGRVMEEQEHFLNDHATGSLPVYVAMLAVEELATNIIKYGYDDTAVHEILLRLEIRPGMLWLLIEDDGHEFNPLTAPEPNIHLPAEERAPGGLGIHLVRKTADEIEYRREGGRNRVTVTIRTGEPPS